MFILVVQYISGEVKFLSIKLNKFILSVILSLFSQFNSVEVRARLKREKITRNSCNNYNNITIAALMLVVIIGSIILIYCNTDGSPKKSIDVDNNGNDNINNAHINTPNNIKLINFEKREVNWIKFLCGEEISDSSFVFSSCDKFREADDKKLEEYHNYVQVVFPSFDKSSFANQDLYIGKNSEKWKEIMSNPDLRSKIQENMRLNLIRMLKFWEFDLVIDGRKITSLSSKNNASPFINGNHNGSRMTRVLKCLKLFGLNNEYDLIMDDINKNHSKCDSYKYWKNTGTKCLF